MAGQVTLTVEADVATWSSGIAAGAGLHLPVGYWSSAIYRSAMRFPVPSGWAGWTGITKAVLEFSITDFDHVGIRNSGLYIRQQSSGAVLWTKAEGTQSCEAGFSGSNTSQYDDIVPTTSNQVSFTTGTTANARKSINVTAMVRSYWSVSRTKMVFIFDPMDSNDYSEIWSRNKGGTYVAKLIIDYEDAAPPLAPTLIAPAAGATIEDQTPNFSWNHNDPDAQVQADVELYDAAGTTLLHTYTRSDAVENINGTDVLPRGVNYQWRARTWDAVSGVGAWSGLRTFTMRALPVVVVDATRRMVFANGAPRLVAQWTSDQPQTHYRVQSSGGYDSTWLAGSDTSHVLVTQAVVSGTAQTITVSSRATYGTEVLEGSSSRAFTPRYGLTTHRKDLTAAPLNWGTPVITQTVPPDTQLVVEYGSDPAANAVPASGWLSSLAAAPLNRYLFWRAWFIPSATVGPTLDKIVIPTDSTVTLVDKWGTTKDTPGLTAPWSVDTGEAVYGTRSLRADVTGAGPFKVYSYKVSLRTSRSYILTGLMKSTGNSGARFRLEDSAGNVLVGGVVGGLPAGNVESPTLVADQNWYNAARNDTVRYRTPVYVAAGDMDAYVVLMVGGTAGAKAWFDAIKLEESTVATPWSPAAIGAVVIDAGGVQVDGTRGGILRYKGSTGGARDTVEGYQKGLLFGGDTELFSPATGVMSIGGVITGASGAFPGTPATGQVHYRTDLNMEFFWDGTRWLSTTLFYMEGVMDPASASPNLAATTASVQRLNPMQSYGTDIWMVDALSVLFIQSGGTALGASHKWVGSVQKHPPDNSTVLVATLNFDSGASAVWQTRVASINALLGTTAAFPAIRLDWTKTGTPGTINAMTPLRISYRIVG